MPFPRLPAHYSSARITRRQCDSCFPTPSGTDCPCEDGSWFLHDGFNLLIGIKVVLLICYIGKWNRDFEEFQQNCGKPITLTLNLFMPMPKSMRRMARRLLPSARPTFRRFEMFSEHLVFMHSTQSVLVSIFGIFSKVPDSIGG